MSEAPRRLWLKRLSFHYPLRAPGTALLLLAVALLGRGLALGNPYGVALGCFALAGLALLAAVTKLQALRLRDCSFHWETAPPVGARRPEASHTLLAEALRTWPLLRVHFRLRGGLRVGRGAVLAVRREIAFSAGGAHAIPMTLPLSGVLDCSGSLHVGDLFGLTRARFGERSRRILPVLPAGFPARPLARIEPATGQEEQSRPRSSDEDKYYMREYLPGDRFRDINWKVSGRLAELITRISPVTQERTTILPVHFRNLRSEAEPRAGDRADGREAVAHLDVLKSWLLAFLRSIKLEHPQMQFHLSTAEGSRLLESVEDIERFAGELSGLFYQRESAGVFGEASQSTGELFVFSTPYDRSLGHYLSARSAGRVCLFRTLGSSAATGEASERLRLLQPGTGCLPGAWVLRRDAPPGVQSPGPGVVNRVEQLRLAVRLL
jgi:hypothetical protein